MLVIFFSVLVLIMFFVFMVMFIVVYAIPPLSPAVRSAPENKHLPMKKNVPVSRA